MVGIHPNPPTLLFRTYVYSAKEFPRCPGMVGQSTSTSSPTLTCKYPYSICPLESSNSKPLYGFTTTLRAADAGVYEATGASGDGIGGVEAGSFCGGGGGLPTPLTASGGAGKAWLQLAKPL